MERRHRHSRLVIGIGNPLRGDDGISALLAELEAVIPAGAGAPDSHRPLLLSTATLCRLRSRQPCLVPRRSCRAG
jgi:hypothetical protein